MYEDTVKAGSQQMLRERRETHQRLPEEQGMPGERYPHIFLTGPTRTQEFTNPSRGAGDVSNVGRGAKFEWPLKLSRYLTRGHGGV